MNKLQAHKNNLPIKFATKKSQKFHSCFTHADSSCKTRKKLNKTIQKKKNAKREDDDFLAQG